MRLRLSVFRLGSRPVCHGRMEPLALVLVSGWTAAEAQLAKSGSYTVYYAWHGKGERITAEKGQFVLGGTSAHGVLINKTGEGFLHNAPTDCAAGFKSVRGVAEVT